MKTGHVESPQAEKLMPGSLRNFLTVTEVDGAPRLTTVKPSPLLGRLQGFLPKMAEANEELSRSAPLESLVTVTKVSVRTDEVEVVERLANKAEVVAVDMDIYVDGRMGKLMGGESGSKTDEDGEDGEDEGTSSEDSESEPKKKRMRPLIEVISDSGKALTGRSASYRTGTENELKTTAE